MTSVSRDSTSATAALPRIAVNLMWCRPGAVGGSEEYLCRQLLGLPTGVFDVVVFAPLGFVSAHPEVAARYDVVEMRHDASSRTRRIVDESTWLYSRSRTFDVVHHGGGTIPARHRDPALLTIHDLQYLVYPHYFGRLRRTYLGWAVPRAVADASLIAVPSQYVRSTVIESFPVDPDDVLVVPHGLEDVHGRSATSEEELRDRYGLGSDPIVVFPAITHPHKGHEFLIDVHSKHWAGDGTVLVLIGGEGAQEGRVRSRVESLDTRDRVRRLGRVRSEDRDGLIKMARALVFPSEYEGFGAPVIEAMALGTPVVTSDRASLPEVVGDAGIVLPLEVDAWGSALDLVAARRDDLIARGLVRSARYTSAVSGAALASAYHRLST